MPDQTLQSRCDSLRAQLDSIGNEFNQLSNDLQITNRIDSANTREIDKLKRHVAKLQQESASKPARPDPSPTRDA